MSLELVLLMPVLVLLTLFVLWAGRGGRVALSADLAAEEAATAAAYCCAEGDAGSGDREAIVQDMLRTRPGLGYLCVDEPHPAAEPDRVGDPQQYVTEEWLEFEPGRTTGGVGVLGVQFTCETDGAVAPLRGLFPIVTFHGQASEIVLRSPVPPGVGFAPTPDVVEGEDLVFTAASDSVAPSDITVSYAVVAPTAGRRQATPVDDYDPVPLSTGNVLILRGTSTVRVVVPTIDDRQYEGGDEYLALQITGVSLGSIDPLRETAEGKITESTPQPYLLVACGMPSTVTEGGVDGTGGVLSFTVRLRDQGNSQDAPAADQIEVDVAAVGGSTGTAATPGTDFAAVPTLGANLIFAPGTTELAVEVTTIDDKRSPVPEGDETVTLLLAAPAPWPPYVTVHGDSCDGTIIDDEAQVIIEGVKADSGIGTDEDAYAAEGVDLEFTLRLVARGNGALPDTDVDVDYELKDSRRGTPATLGDECGLPDAVDGPDYPRWEDPPGSGTFTASGTVTFRQPSSPTGETTKTITVPTCVDPLVEHREQFWLEVTVPIGNEAAVRSGSGINDAYGGSGHILNDDIAVVVVADQSARETDGTMTFDVGLKVNGGSARLTEDVTVDFATQPRTATGGSACGDPGTDYVSRSAGSLTFTPTMAERQVVVDVCDDSDGSELDETFVLVFENPLPYPDMFDGDPAAADPPTLEATGTIINVAPATLSVNDVDADEGETLTFTVTLTDPRIGQTVNVDYEVDGGTAQAGIDYEDTLPPDPLTGTLTLSDVALTDTVEVLTLRDTIADDGETVSLVLSNRRPANVKIGDAEGTGTITDVAPAIVRISNPTAAEGDALEFVISLHQQLDVDNDGDGRPDEVPFPMSDLAGDIVVDYATEDRGAVAGADYDAVDSADPAHSPITFTSGGLSARTVAVTTLRDAVADGGEDVALVLSVDPDIRYGALGDAEGTGTITDVDSASLIAEDTFVDEGDDIVFAVTLCNSRVGETVTVKYRSESRSAKQGLDYVDDVSGTLTFVPASLPEATGTDRGRCGPGAVSVKRLTIPRIETLPDKISENPESVALVLSDATNADTDDDTGFGVINDVPPAIVRISNPTAAEGDDLEFLISLRKQLDVDNDGDGMLDQVAFPTSDLARDVTVEYWTADRSATAGAVGTPDADYEPISETPPSSVTFTPGGDSHHSVPVTTYTDTTDESDETLSLLLFVDPNSPVASLGDTEGTGTIRDRPPPRIRIDDASAQEGDTLTFTVSLVDENGVPTSTSENVTVKYETGDQSALTVDCPDPTLLTGRCDYDATSGDIEIAAGLMQETITVRVLADDVWEPEERLRVDLYTPEHAILDRAVGIGTIRANCIGRTDPQVPTITVHGEEIWEGTRGPDPIGTSPPHHLWLSFSRPLCDQSTLNFRVVYHSDDPDEHMVLPYDRRFPFDLNRSDLNRGIAVDLPLATLRVQAAESEADRILIYSYHANRDALDEYDERFFVEYRWGVGMPSHYPKGNDDWVRGVYTILDDDPEPSLRISDASAQAGDAMTFTVSLDAESGRDVHVGYYTVDVTAQGGGADYASVTPSMPSTVTIPEGSTTATFTVQTAANAPDEPDETFRVRLVNAVHATVDDGVGIGTILAGTGPNLRVFDASADEDASMQFRVLLSSAATQPISVDYRTTERPQGRGAATEGADYQPRNGPLLFAVGDEEQFIDVPILDDTETEPPETFFVELSNPTAGVSLADSSAVGTINADVDCVDSSFSSNEPMPGTSITAADGTDSIEAREDSGRITASFVLERPLCHPYRIYLVTPSGTATADEDYIAFLYNSDHHVSLAAFETEVDIHVELLDDEIAEGTESFVLASRHYGYGDHRNLPLVSAEPRILDDDVASLVLPTLAGTETVEGGHLSFVVRLDGPTTERVTFDYVTADGSVRPANADADYEPRQSTAAITPGELSVTIPVRTIEDELDEYDETVALVLSNLAGAEPDPDGDTAIGRIVDDDEPPGVSVSNAAADEGDDLQFVVELETKSGRPTSVGFTTRDGTGSGGATAPGDYGARSGTVSFDAGETRKVVSVTASSDTAIEGDERFWLDLVLGSVDGLRLGDRIGEGTIRDVTERRVGVADAFVSEGGVLSFTVSFEGTPRSRDITIDYRTAQDTATVGDDYSNAFETQSGQVRILAGQNFASVQIPTVEDNLDEAAERLYLRLSNPAGAVLEDPEAAGVIIDDDPAPSLSIDDPEVTEGDDTEAIFTLTLSEQSGRAVTVTYNTADGTATAGNDYTAVQAAGETATIPAGDSSVRVAVALVDDSTAEEVENFQLVLSAPDNATLADTIGVARILDDDGTPQILVDNPAPVREGDGATIEFVVRLSRAATDEITVDYETEAATATAGDDFVADSDTLTFTAGDNEKTVSIALVNDSVIEQTETFRLKLTNTSTTATIGTDTATATILDDDALSAMSVADAAAAEGSSASFVVSLDKASAQAITVQYAAVTDPTAGGTAAIPAQDFTEVSGTLTVPARSTTATVSVPLRDDTLDEHSETFWLRLSDPNGARIEDGTAVGTITDNDPLPQITIADAGEPEGETLRFAITMNSASGRTVSVPWATEPRGVGDNPATPDDDYTAGSGTLTFTAGNDTAYVDIATVDDDIDEADETLLVQLGEPTFATLDDSTAVGVIRDNDSEPRILITDTEVLETDSPAVFTVALSRRSSQPVTVAYQTTDGTATAGTDYATTADGASGTLTIPAGIELGEISVYVVDDSIAEDTETFHITLSDPTNAVVAADASTATAYILDNERARLSISGAQASEGDGTIEFEVALLDVTSNDVEVTVEYATFDDSATQPDDYLAASGTVTIPSGSISNTISVTLADDEFTEDTEQFLVRLSDVTNADLVDAQAIGDIIDDDALPVITLPDYPKFREDAGTISLRLALNRASDVEVSVDYATGTYWPGTCDQPYVATSGTVVFAPGSVAEEFEVTLVDDMEPCALYDRIRRTFDVDLSNPQNANFGIRKGIAWRTGEPYSYPRLTDSISVTVWDVARLPCIGSIGPAGVLEGDGPFVFTAILNRTPDDDVRFRAYTTSASIRTWTAFQEHATSGVDYTAVNVEFTIPAGSLSTTVEVDIIDDSTVENLEGLALGVQGLENVLYLYADCIEHHDPRSEAWIIDDDATPELTVGDVDVTEDAGSATFEISVNRVSSSVITVDFETVDGSATAPNDYTAISGEAQIDAGFTSTFVTVPIIDDAETEGDETFELRLSNANGATIDVGVATATIRDDESITLPSLSVADATGSDNDGCLRFTVTLSEPSMDDVTFRASTVAVPSLGDYAATPAVDHGNEPGADYTSLSGQYEYTITAGGTVTYFCVSLPQYDSTPEFDEQFRVVLHDPVGATLGKASAWATILDDDTPIVTIADQTISESAGTVTFTVELHEPGVYPASLRYATAVRGSAGDQAARPDEDYAHTAGTLPIPAGQTTATITVPIYNDSADEADESFLLELTQASALEFSDSTAVGIITDDDPGWWVNDVSVREGTSTMQFSVQRDHTSTTAVTVEYEVTGASASGGATADGCVNGVDFLLPSGSAVVQPTETQVSISVTICDDTDAEARETLLLELTNVDGRDLSAVGTIIDND